MVHWRVAEGFLATIPEQDAALFLIRIIAPDAIIALR